MINRVTRAFVFALVTAGSRAWADVNVEPGLLVEEVARGSAGDIAGLKPGDILTSWTRAAALPLYPEPARGDLRSFFDLFLVETEQRPLGDITLDVQREGQMLALPIGPTPWNVKTGPPMPAVLAELYQEGRARIAAGDLAEGTALWHRAAERARAAGQRELAAGLFMKAGEARNGKNKSAEAEAAYLAAVEAAPTARARIVIHSQRSRNLVGRQNAAADAALDAALSERATGADDDLLLALLLHQKSLVALNGERADEVERHARRSLEIRERLAPDSVPVVASLTAIGNALRMRNDYESREVVDRKALSIIERLAPRSAEMAAALSNGAITAMKRADFARAEDMLRRAITILRPSGVPDRDHWLAAALANLATVEGFRGDDAAAFDLTSEALSLREGFGRVDEPLAIAYHNLSVYTADRDLEAAERYLRRALEIRETLAPGSAAVGRTFCTLGRFQLRRRDHEQALVFGQKGLALLRSSTLARRDAAACLWLIGDVERDRGGLAAAEVHYSEALALYRRHSADGERVPDVLSSIADVKRRQGDVVEAARLYGEAMDILDRQAIRIRGSQEDQARFRERFELIYAASIDVSMSLGRVSEAFHTVERSRARSLLSLLSERDLVFRADAPKELEATRKRLEREYDEAQSRLAQLEASNAEEIERAAARLRELGRAQQAVRDELRKAAPRYAALRYPQPLDLAAVRRTLDPGTLLLSYAVAADATWLFAVRAAGDGDPGISAFKIDVTEQALRQKIASFRDRLQAFSAADREGLAADGAALYDLVLRPAESLTRRAHRLLVCLDGPLHVLPFAALRRGGAYVAEWKPLHAALSATVYAELRKSRGAPSTDRATLAAFGDPDYPRVASGRVHEIRNAEVREEVKRGREFRPLPASRAEVRAIADLYRQSSRVYLGSDATEEQAKASSGGARYVHYACHAVVNERFPLNSALALAIPEHPAEGQDNGLLQAWEIFEHVRLDADLVTLSACDSARGKEIGGEGLMGLTRAFHYAGAPSVVASLWSVADDSTADLMTRFYGHLKRGATKDGALRKAQVEMVRRAGDASHPARWAAFVLFGDWK